MKKLYLLLWVIVIMITSIVTGCSHKSTKNKSEVISKNTTTKTPTKAPDSQELVASYQPCLHALPQYMAIKNGWYEEEGIKFEFKYYPSGLYQNEDLLSDKWEVGDEGTTGATLASMRYGLYIIGISNEESETNDIWVRPDSDILGVKGYNPKYPDIYGSPEMIRGKTIITTSASTGHYAVIATLKALGLRERDVKTIHMEQTEALIAFEEGQGDIVQLWAPYGYIAEEKGWIKISSGKKAGVSIPGVLVASKKAVEEKPELVAKWLELYLKGIQVMKDDPIGSAKLLDEFYMEHDIEISDDALSKEFAIRPLYNTKEQLERFDELKQAMIELADFFVEQGRINKEDRDKWVQGDLITDKFLQMVADKEEIK